MEVSINSNHEPNFVKSVFVEANFSLLVFLVLTLNSTKTGSQFL